MSFENNLCPRPQGTPEDEDKDGPVALRRIYYTLGSRLFLCSSFPTSAFLIRLAVLHAVNVVLPKIGIQDRQRQVNTP